MESLRQADREAAMNNYYPVQADHQEFIPVSELNEDYMSLLRQLRQRISCPRAGDNLETVVSLIQKTGCFDIVDDNFTFDLCLLDKRTIKKITKCLGIHVK